MATQPSSDAKPAFAPAQVEHRATEPPRLPDSGGGDDGAAGLVSVALVGTCVAAYWAGEWAAGVGQSWVEAVFGNVGPGGGSGGGGNGPPCHNLPKWICSGADFDVFGWGPHLPEGFTAAVMLLLFLGFLAYWLYLLIRMPLIPTWRNHVALAKVIKPSPFVVMAVVLIANSDYLMTTLGRLSIFSRLWGAFITALVGFAYLSLIAMFAPKEIAAPDGSDAAQATLDRKKPPVRYLLSLLAVVFLLNTGHVAATLIPNTLAAVPPEYNWWCVLWPFGCHVQS